MIYSDHDRASHSYQRRRRGVVEITSPRERRRVEEAHRVMVVKPRHERSESCHSEKCLARMQGQTLQALTGGGQWRARTPLFTAGFTAPGQRSVGCVGVQTRGWLGEGQTRTVDKLACAWCPGGDVDSTVAVTTGKPAPHSLLVQWIHVRSYLL